MRVQVRIVAGALRGRKLHCEISPDLRPCVIERDTRGGIIDVDPTNPPADLPNCCARNGASFETNARLQSMTNTQQTSKDETANTNTADEAARGCCGGPAPVAVDTPPPPMVVYNRPFGGVVAVHGKIAVPGAPRYRFLLRQSGGSCPRVRIKADIAYARRRRSAV